MSIVLFCVVLFWAFPVVAGGDNLPNQPKLVHPNTNKLFAMGLPPGQTGKWVQREFPNNNGNYLALCLDYLSTQPIFPAAGPAVADGMFCLADIKITGLQQYSSLAFISSSLAGRKSTQLVLFPNCTVLVENGTIVPGVTTLNGTSQFHVISCPGDEGPPPLLGQFITTELSPGATVQQEYVFLEFKPSLPGKATP